MICAVRFPGRHVRAGLQRGLDRRRRGLRRLAPTSTSPAWNFDGPRTPVNCGRLPNFIFLGVPGTFGGRTAYHSQPGESGLEMSGDRSRERRQLAVERLIFEHQGVRYTPVPVHAGAGLEGAAEGA
jgi:hypothetical protein